MGTFSFIFELLWCRSTLKLRVAFILAFFFLCLSKVASGLVPFFYKFLFEAASKIDGINTVGPVVLLILGYTGVRFLSQILNEIKEVFFVLVEQNSVRALALEAFSHLQSMGLKFHVSKKIGEISKITERGTKAIETFLRFLTFSILPTFLEMIFVCALVLIFYPYYYCVSLTVTLLCYCIYTVVITQWRTGYVKKMKVADNQSSHRAMDSLVNYETVKYFNNQCYEVSCYSALLKDYSDLAIRNKRYLSILNIGQGLIIALGLVVINLAVVFDILSGAASLGDFALVNAYLLQLYVPLGNLGFSYRELKLAYIDIDLLRMLLSEKSDDVDSGNTDFVFDSGTVEFKNVSFQYSDGAPILKDLSFRIEKGKTLAIVGKSGSGKSTISKLLFGLYTPSKGRILIDDQDIQYLRKETFQKYIGVVPQDITLFNDTIFNNIAYANPGNATLDDVIKVAKLASIHDLVMSTEDQYQTIVGERGLKLSGGEKQRVAIARMLLKENAKILIFDEASSSLDGKTEAVIKESIEKIGRNCTSLIIAHRLSTVVYADEIIILSEGKIVERGKHSTLLARKGIYYRMWQHQDEQTQTSV
ncbi:ABC transporter family protein [Neorickettsia helminthoeca str. Oregon]|uniref:ABC transporter family protein n=1 Tax=Neorickettsia helminthoeca str. Oregon TaxID=1286528 RepID=X5GXG6_9RICK|nr:ABC transporter ATP-binding protein/permease [Neorickettsia helminthoeca]AHX11747.1 ABC transporter family protein [Neorickettsia helminthoeca str. Oregon]